MIKGGKQKRTKKWLCLCRNKARTWWRKI